MCVFSVALPALFNRVRPPSVSAIYPYLLHTNRFGIMDSQIASQQQLQPTAVAAAASACADEAAAAQKGMETAVLVDWKGRTCNPQKHGGMKAAVFVMGLQASEIMAIAAVGNNLITYVFNDLHYPLAKAANIVTNFVGTIFLVSLLGGYLADSHLGSLLTMIVFGLIELCGYIVMAAQAHVSALKPAPCDMLKQQNCRTPNGVQALCFYGGLYLVALGSGCLKPNMIAYGADQFEGDRRMSTYFNFAYLSFCIGELLSLTLLIWVQTRAGVDIGFAISAGIMLAGLLSLISGLCFYRNRVPGGSVFTRLAQVFVAAFRNRNFHPTPPPDFSKLAHRAHSDQFRFLDKAAMAREGEEEEKQSGWRRCSVEQVEQLKAVLRVLPIFACTIIVNCVLAQLQTFSVQQGAAMDNSIGGAKGFSIPPASMQAIPYAMLVFAVPLYEVALVPAARRVTGTQSGITELQRIGVGLLLSAFSMLAAALVEQRRLRHHQSEHHGSRLLSIAWLAPQFVIFGSSEMFTAVGLIEFFYRRAPVGMQSLLTALTYVSYSLGFFLSSVLVNAVDAVTSAHGGRGWLGSNDLNDDHLDRFYWLLALLSILNLLHFLFWAHWFQKSCARAVPASSASSAGL